MFNQLETVCARSDYGQGVWVKGRGAELFDWKKKQVHREYQKMPAK